MKQYKFVNGLIRKKYNNTYYTGKLITLCVESDMSVLNLNPGNCFRLPITLGVSKRHFKDHFVKTIGKQEAEKRMTTFFYRLNTFQLVPATPTSKEHILIKYELEERIANAPISLTFKTMIGINKEPLLVDCQFRSEDLIASK